MGTLTTVADLGEIVLMISMGIMTGDMVEGVAVVTGETAAMTEDTKEGVADLVAMVGTEDMEEVAVVAEATKTRELAIPYPQNPPSQSLWAICQMTVYRVTLKTSSSHRMSKVSA